MYVLPTDLTMVYGSVTYSTIEDAVEAQTKVGINLLGNFYIGPEAAFSWRNVRNVTPSFDNVAELRVGGHISAITLGQVQAGLSAGWTHQDQVGSGYYGGLEFYCEVLRDICAEACSASRLPDFTAGVMRVFPIHFAGRLLAEGQH